MCRQGLLSHTEILSLENKSESESSTASSTLLVFTSQLPTPTPPPPPYKMSQHDLHTIIRQQQEQLVAMQTQLQALVERGVGGEATTAAVGSTEVVKLQIFDGTSSKVSVFVIACRLYLRMKMREVVVEEQIQWVLSYVQGGSADVWKKNMLEDLEAGVLEYETVGEFLVDIRKEFGGGDEESVKVAKLKKLEQGEKTMEEYV